MQLKRIEIDFENGQIFVNDEQVQKTILVQVNGELFFEDQWNRYFTLNNEERIPGSPAEGRMMISYESSKQ